MVLACFAGGVGEGKADNYQRLAVTLIEVAILPWICSSNGRVPECHLCPNRKSLHTSSIDRAIV
jgi:hypothetical protein